MALARLIGPMRISILVLALALSVSGCAPKLAPVDVSSRFTRAVLEGDSVAASNYCERRLTAAEVKQVREYVCGDSSVRRVNSVAVVVSYEGGDLAMCGVRSIVATPEVKADDLNDRGVGFYLRRVSGDWKVELR